MREEKLDWSQSKVFLALYCMLSKRIWLQHFWFFGQHCNEWHNESQSRLRSNLLSAVNLRHINIILVQTGPVAPRGVDHGPQIFRVYRGGGTLHISSKHSMGPTPFYGARAEETQKADFAMKQTNIHRVSKKLCKLIFCQNFAKFRRIVKNFGIKIAERTGFSEVYSFSTPPNLCQHTTV